MPKDNEEIEGKVLDLPLTKQGNSIAVIIPKKVLNALELETGDFVRVVCKKNGSE